MITHPKKARLVDDEEASNSPNTSQYDDKVANMVYQRKQNLHFTMPVLKNTIDKKPKLYANNKNCSHTKNKSKIQKQKIVSSKLKKMQDNQNKSCKHEKFLKTSTMIDKLALKKNDNISQIIDYTIYQCKICFEAWPQKTKIRSNKKPLSNCFYQLFKR